MPINWDHDQGFDPAIDAYLDWLRGPEKRFQTDFQDHVTPAVLHVTDQFDKTEFFELVEEEISHLPDLSVEASQLFPDIYFSETYLGDVGYFTGLVPGELLDSLINHRKFHTLIQRITVGRPVPAQILAAPQNPVNAIQNTEDTPPQANTVIIGIVDEGIAFANERFRSGLTETRVEYAWLQDGKSAGPVDRFCYGREWRKEAINNLLEDCQRGGQIDEDKFYARSGVADFARPGHKAVSWRVAHGTHVMDLSAGFPEGQSIQGDDQTIQDWRIICVQLPTATIADTSGLGLEKFLLDGINYIFDRARMIAADLGSGELPVVINFSSGIRAGPHDGSSTIEAELDKLIARRRASDPGRQIPTQIVLPAGNSFLSRSHAKFDLNAATSQDSEQTVEWFVAPDDKTSSYVEIWLPKDFAAGPDNQIALKITTPAGLESDFLVTHPGNNGEHAMVLRVADNEDEVVGKAYYQHVGPPTNRGRFLIALLPTAFHNASSRLAPAGRWKITLKNLGALEVSLHAWIHWDDSPLNYIRHGRQSYFMDKHYIRFDPVSGRELEIDQDESLITRKGTTSAIAMGDKPVVVGGFHRREHKAASYSAGDFDTRSGKPGYMTVCEASSTLLGVLAAGTKSGSTVALNGTSVAAPQITRRIAELMAAGKSDQQIKAGLDAVALADEHDLEAFTAINPQIYPAVMTERKGLGRLKQKIHRKSERERLVEG